MSSRGNFLGTGPASGVYTPKPTPQKAEEMPIYINDELLDLGGRLNNILEGGAFPPQSQLPKRVKDGMMIYFTQPITNSPISSAGVWLYRKEKWWKIIDDPSAVSQNLTVYKKFPKGSTRPSKPPINKYLVDDLNGWDYVPKANDEANDQWMSVAVWAVTDPDNPIVDWAEPIMFNTEGSAGQPGSDGYSIEFRYIASTLKPSIKDKLATVPVTNEGKAYQTNVPNVTHPNENYVWQIQTYTRNGELGQPWSDPVRYSTPDTTKANSCYAVARDGYPTFNANAAGLPGPEWVATVPANIPTGYNLWRSDRLDWTDGTPQTPWSTPYKANGTIGSKSETRYIASTEVPTIANKLARNPVTSTGEAYTTALPSTNPPLKTFVWAITGIVNRLNEMEIAWSDPAKYATPDTTNTAKCFAIGSLTDFPSFTNTNPGLPGNDWSKTFPGALSEGQYIWESQRLEWSNGTAQTNWTTPVRTTGYDGTDGTSFEQRYRASTATPSLAVSDRNPAGWTKTIPAVSHPNNSYIWVTSASIDTSDKLVGTWATPSRYASPDTTYFRYAYGLGTTDTYPTFNPSAAGLPGAGWGYEIPKPNKGQRIWVTGRYQWNDSTGTTNWMPPSLFSGVDGLDGNHGNDGFTMVEIYKNAATKPAEIPDAERAYPPSGWSKTQTSPPMGEVTWSSKNYVRGKVEEATTVVYNYSGVVQLSGSAGQDGNPGADGSDGVDGKTKYNWIMYADTETGSGISSNPLGKKYVGFAYNKDTATPSINSFDYAWYKLEGTQGIPGQAGADGITYYTWVKYADDASGSGMSDSPLNKKYLGLAYNKIDATESSDPSLYTWSLIKGDQGIPGTPGEDGVTFYTWIKYARDNIGTGITDDPTGMLYMGVAYNKLDQQESDDPTKYTWSLIKGSDGIDGKPGLPGADGVTYYTWIKYADNAAGDNMSDFPTGKDYIGIAANKPVPTESSVAADYQWSKLHGDQGIPGTNGVDGKTYYTWVKYADTAVGGGMSDDPTGKDYLGLAYNKESSTESSVPTDYTWSKIHGDQGIAGEPGVDGKTYYTWIKYADDVLGTGITDDPTDKKYIGIAYNQLVQQESTDPALYAWSLIKGSDGKDGIDGVPGIPGKDGVTTYTWVKYAANETGSDMSDFPSPAREYIGLAHNKTTATESDDYRDYQWSKLHGDQGVPGDKGADGITYYTWVKYADNDQGSGFGDDPTNKGWLGLAYNKTTATESTNYRDYTWSKIHGDQGIPGNNGADGKTYYTWIKYANDTVGTGITDDPTGMKYIGIGHNKIVQQESTDYREYSWSKIQGEDGQDGVDGQPGINGNPGLDGSPGAGFYRLSMTNFTTWPSQATVDTAFRNEFGRDSEQDDVLTIYDSVTTTRAETRRKDKTGAWVAAELLVHGDMILRGTIVADRIAAGTITSTQIAAGTITAGSLAANSVTSDKIVANVSLTAPSITAVNISGGRIGIGSGEPFKVENDGSLTATKANITGAINATSGTFRGTVTGSRIEASTIGIGSGFSVDANGLMTCTGANIGGTLNSVNGTFTGNLSAAGGTFKGTVQAGVIDGGTVQGSQIRVPASNSKFIVTSAGDMTCNNATINGSYISNGEITGTGIYLPNKTNPYFSVDASGNMVAKSGTFLGTVYADKVVGGVVSGDSFTTKEHFINDASVEKGKTDTRTFDLFSFSYRRDADSSGKIPSMDVIISNLPTVQWIIKPNPFSFSGSFDMRDIEILYTVTGGASFSGTIPFLKQIAYEYVINAESLHELVTSLAGLTIPLPSVSNQQSNTVVISIQVRLTLRPSFYSESQRLNHTISINKGDSAVTAVPVYNNFAQIS